MKGSILLLAFSLWSFNMAEAQTPLVTAAKRFQDVASDCLLDVRPD